jgi:hypothetical protein
MQKIKQATALQFVTLMATPRVSPQSSEVFRQGVEFGQECSQADQAEGFRLHTINEIWDLLEHEISPAAVHTEKLSIEKQAGFVVGYLSDMFAPQETRPAPLRVRPGQRAQQRDRNGYTLDASGFPMDM